MCWVVCACRGPAHEYGAHRSGLLRETSGLAWVHVAANRHQRDMRFAIGRWSRVCPHKRLAA